MLRRAHFGQGQMKGQRRLGSLILTHPVFVQTVTASPRAEVVERLAKVIAPQEPLEGALRLMRPERNLRCPKGLAGG